MITGKAYEALHRLDYTSGSRRWKKSSSNIFDCDNLNIGVKITEGFQNLPYFTTFETIFIE